MFVRSINAGFRLIDQIAASIGAISLLATTAIVFFSALSRYIFSYGVTGSEELARLLMITMTFLGAYVLLRQDRHVNVDILNIAISPAIQRILRGATALTGTLLMLYLAWWSWQLVSFSANTGQRAPTLPVPRYFFFLPIAVGSSLMVLAGIDKLVRAITNTLPPLPSAAGDVK